MFDFKKELAGILEVLDKEDIEYHIEMFGELFTFTADRIDKEVARMQEQAKSLTVSASKLIDFKSKYLSKEIQSK